jgi:hypothetical protein
VLSRKRGKKFLEVNFSVDKGEEDQYFWTEMRKNSQGKGVRRGRNWQVSQQRIKGIYLKEANKKRRLRNEEVFGFIRGSDVSDGPGFSVPGPVFNLGPYGNPDRLGKQS